MVRHLNKGSGEKAIYRGGGSIGLIGAARLAFAVTLDPASEDERVLLAATKSNIAAKPKTLAYRIGVDYERDCSKIIPNGTSPLTAIKFLAIRVSNRRDRR